MAGSGGMTARRSALESKDQSVIAPSSFAVASLLRVARRCRSAFLVGAGWAPFRLSIYHNAPMLATVAFGVVVGRHALTGGWERRGPRTVRRMISTRTGPRDLQADTAAGRVRHRVAHLRNGLAPLPNRNCPAVVRAVSDRSTRRWR